MLNIIIFLAIVVAGTMLFYWLIKSAKMLKASIIEFIDAVEYVKSNNIFQ